MSAIGSILFLALLVLVPLLMVLLLFWRAISRRRINRIWKKADRSGVFRVVPESSGERASLEQLLEQGPLAHAGGFSHRISHARVGTVAGSRVWVAYVESGGAGVPGQRQSRKRFITLVQAPGFARDLVLQRPAAGRLGSAIVEQIGGFRSPAEEQLAAFRTNDPAALSAQNLGARADLLLDLLSPGDTLALTGDSASHIRPGDNEFHRAAVARYLGASASRAEAILRLRTQSAS